MARGRQPGQPKTGGRLRKSLDKGERQLVSAELAGSILTTFERLGGVDDMLSWASANRTVFYTQVLSRLFPAPQRGDDHPEVQVNTQVNIGNMSDFEAAQRIAFALAKAAYEQEQATPAIEAVRVTSARAAPEPVEQPEMSPQEACRWGAPDQPNPSPEPEGLDPARERWAADLSLTPEQRAANALVRDTIECDITNYHGSAAEQPDASLPRPAPRQPSAGERRRAVMSRRGRDLL